MFLSLLRITIGFILLDVIFEKDKEHPVWMCFFVFLNILTAAASFRQKSDYSAGPQIPVYVLGSAVISIINAVSLATEVFLKAEKGERTVEDLQLIVLPFESFFLACWFGFQLFLYCMQEKEIIKDQLRLIDRCCKKGRSPTSSPQNQEAAEMESLSKPVQSPTQRQEGRNSSSTEL
ncbi:hypothetical protein GJAV_G00048680 [Gymnothorax javanicus]|nr:hypothetical protein GJAV_G00048680 [Gymnothorax javanicus]